MIDAQTEKPADEKQDELVEIEIEVEGEAEEKADAAGAQAEAAETAKPAADPAADNKDADADDDDDDDGDDDRLSADQREDKKSRRQRAKERRRQAIEQNRLALQQAEIRAARAELNTHKMEVRFAAFEAQQQSQKIDAEAERLQSEYRRLQQAKADAVSKNNGAAVVQADHQLLDVQRRYDELNRAKARASDSLNAIGARLKEIEAVEAQIAQGVMPSDLAADAAPTASRAPVAQPQLNAEGARLRDAFLAEIPWFKANAKDGASRAIQMIDQAVAAEGYDMNTPAYWNELRDRVKLAMPQQFVKKNPAPPVGSSREPLAANKTTVRLPKEAVETMRLAGILDDSNKVADQKRYAAYVSQLKAAMQAQKRA
jgi:hypothetical protein